MRENEGLIEILIGTGVCLSVTLWDLFLFGIRGFFQYAVHWRGITIMWLGIGLILYGAWRNYRQWR